MVNINRIRGPASHGRPLTCAGLALVTAGGTSAEPPRFTPTSLLGSLCVIGYQLVVGAVVACWTHMICGMPSAARRHVACPVHCAHCTEPTASISGHVHRKTPGLKMCEWSLRLGGVDAVAVYLLALGWGRDDGSSPVRSLVDPIETIGRVP